MSQWIDAAAADEVPPGDVIGVAVQGREIALYGVDGEVIELSQKGFEQKPYHRTLAELGGREVGDTDHMVTETLIRGMYEYWRKAMED